jgi:hypothetical protein
MYPDSKEPFSVFNAHIDTPVKHDVENARAICTALTEFGAPFEGLAPEEFAGRGSCFRMGREP